MANSDLVKHTALTGIAGIGILGLSGWASVIYAAYQYGKGNNGRALTGLGAGVMAFLAARAVAKRTVTATKAALSVSPTFTTIAPQRPMPPPVQDPEQHEYAESVASEYDVE